MRKRSWLLAATIGVLAAMPAAAKDIDSVTGDDVVRLLEAAGYRATLGVDGVGEPLVSSHAADADFFVSFYGCDAGRCGSIQFRSGFALEDDVPLEVANEWNQQMRYAEAWIDEEGDPWLEMDIDLSEGATEAQVTGYIEIWRFMLEAYQAHIGF